MKAYWGSGGTAHAFLTSALHGGKWSASRPGRFTPKENVPYIQRIGGWVGPGIGLETVVKRKIPIIAPAVTQTP
jgi:hypothetical protein